MTPVWGPAPPAGANNAYLTAVNAELGTPVDFSVQDGNTYADKLNAMLGARDVPDLLCVPSWEVTQARRGSATRWPRSSRTSPPYLQGAAVSAVPDAGHLPDRGVAQLRAGTSG